VISDQLMCVVQPCVIWLCLAMMRGQPTQEKSQQCAGDTNCVVYEVYADEGIGNTKDIQLSGADDGNNGCEEDQIDTWS